MDYIKRCNISCRLHKTGLNANSGGSVAVIGMTKQVVVSLYWLLSYHREINVIELVWSEIKRRVAVNNTVQRVFYEQFIRWYIRCDTHSRHVEETAGQIGRRTFDRTRRGWHSQAPIPSAEVSLLITAGLLAAAVDGNWLSHVLGSRLVHSSDS